MANNGIGSWPQRRAEMTPHRTALLFEDDEITYGELNERVARLSHALTEFGVRPGDRVAYLGTNHPAFFDVLFATLNVGAVLVPVNTRLAVEEVAFILSDSGTDIVFYGEDKRESIDRFRSAIPHVQQWIDAESTIDELITAHSPWQGNVPVEMDGPAIIMYTSGTTGRPKGAVLSHANITWASINQMIDLDIRPDETTLSVAPLFHIGGLNGTVLTTILKGGRVVILRGFDPAAVLTAIRDYRVNSFFAVPTMLDMLATHDQFPETDVSCIRSLVVGGAPPPDVTLDRWLKRGVPVQQAFGMTEAAPSVSMLAGEDAHERRGSAGKRSFFTELKIVDADGEIALPDVIGEILLRGPNVFSGYWQREDATRDAFDGEWYRSGDAGLLDADGYLYIRDRYKDMYISGGENVYPAEVENVLKSCPGIAEVAVIGVPDEKWGEVGLAIVVAEPGRDIVADAVIEHAKNHLAPFKVPKRVTVVDELPKTASGKITKQVLRANLG